METTITFRIQNETFTFQGKEILQAGFTDVFPFNVMSSSEVIPEVIVNMNYPVTEVGKYVNIASAVLVIYRIYFSEKSCSVGNETSGLLDGIRVNHINGKTWNRNW